ncbi:spore germination protein [Bacillus marasmi]|uniref:spore germination protein n=1 Tax=Bacillus marasmi TaxID=1926279 RepID=UPI0011C6EC30|nr:spore germination protein [Bacillus marasmi]
MDEQLKQKLERNIDANIDCNVNIFRDILEDSVDLAQRNFVFHKKKKLRAVIFYTDGLANTENVGKLIENLVYKTEKIHPEMNEMNQPKEMAEILKQTVMDLASLKVITKISDGIDALLTGDTVLFIDHSEKAFVASTRGWDTRSVDEPQTDQIVRGARDGFTESIRTNTALVRRRIRDPLLRIEGFQIGTKSKTDVNIAYLKGTAKDGLVEEVKKRLNGIKIDAILESGYIEEMIEDAPLSPFSTIQCTERPDKVASSIYEGRVAIFTDNTPFVLIVPTFFWQFLQASDDYYSRYLAGSFFRIIRYIAFIISLTLPSIFVMLVSFHQEMIPTPLALTIASGRDVIPFPVLLEALTMEITFELMREAGLRMPKPIGQAVSIVGSLVIGQAAVQAGIVSPTMVIVVAVTGISSFAIPNPSASFSIRLIRFPLLIASGTLGLLGFAMIFVLIALHAMSLRSFGESYLAPATPFKPGDQKDSIIRFPWWAMNTLPEDAQGVDAKRMGQNQIPKPPNDGAQVADKDINHEGKDIDHITQKLSTKGRFFKKVKKLKLDNGRKKE